MPQSAQINRRIVLAQRPKGPPTDQTLRLETGAVPVAGAGQMLLRTEFLSLDPYMRGRMSDAPSYAPPVAIGDVMVGGTVARVVTSGLAGFAPGDWVLSYSGWQDYAVSDGKGVSNLGQTPANPSWALGVLGMPGFTAWAGLQEIGRPKAGETLVVAAATGAVGSVVGQIGLLRDCTVIGIAGGPEKCAYAVETLGFHDCLDHHTPDLPDRLKQATPKGIDIYFENVGGPVFDAVLPQLNPNARVPVCGLIATYNATKLPDGPDRMGWLMGQILRRRITMRGFIIFDDFGQLYPDFTHEMTRWIEAGRIQYREDVVAGLENAPRAFAGLLEGANKGKLVVKVGP